MKTGRLAVAVPVLALVVLGIGLAVLFDAVSAEKDDLWWSLSRASIGLAITSLGGAVATGAFRVIDGRRERDRELRRLLHQVVGAYNDVKSARRRFKALGAAGGRTTPLISAEVEELREAIAQLNCAQLAFETMKREVGKSDVCDQRTVIVRELDAVERHINETVLKKWQAHAPAGWANVDSSYLTSIGLNEFVQTRSFRANVSSRLDTIELAFQQQLFGKARTVEPAGSAGSGSD